MNKKYIVLPFLLLSYLGFSQITFNGCHPLFEDQDYTFNNVGTNETGRHIFETTPIIGDNSCGALGSCEFRLSWNDSNNRWEFIADSGNGDFVDPYLMFTNTSASTPNPPSLTLGTWVENIIISEGGCDGNLTTSNTVLTGDVQDTVLSIIDNQLSNEIQLAPNPAHTHLSIIGWKDKIQHLKIYDVNGKLVLRTSELSGQIDVSYLPNGMYFVNLFGPDTTLIKKLIKQ